MPFIMLIPLIGLLGLVDTSVARTEATASGLKLQVKYPSKLRHRTLEPLHIDVTNETGAALPDLEIRMDKRYFQAFENVQFKPEPDEIDADSLVFTFENVPSGAHRCVEVEMEALKAWSRTARIEASSDRNRGPAVTFQTFVFP